MLQGEPFVLIHFFISFAVQSELRFTLAAIMCKHLQREEKPIKKCCHNKLMHI